MYKLVKKRKYEIVQVLFVNKFAMITEVTALEKGKDKGKNNVILRPHNHHNI